MKSLHKLKGLDNYMKPTQKMTQGILLFSLLPLASFGANLQISITPSTNTYTLGDPIPIVVEFIYKGRGSAGFNESGLSVQVNRQIDGKLVKVTGLPWPPAAYFINPNSVKHFKWDVNKVPIKDPGQYTMEAFYKDYVTEIFEHNGVETGAVSRLVTDARSDKISFTVLPLDQQMIDNIERLLLSKKEEEQLEGIALLSNSGNGIFRELLPTLWSMVLERKSPVSDKAFILVLNRIDLSVEIVPISELFSELAYATTSSDASLRVAVAESISPLRKLQWGRDEKFSFYLLKIPQWFERETSPACRVALVRHLPSGSNYERIITIAQEDTSPQVRLAAIQRLSAYAPHIFLESTDTFTNLVGQVTVDGEEISLEKFVEQEKERLSERYNK